MAVNKQNYDIATNVLINVDDEKGLKELQKLEKQLEKLEKRKAKFNQQGLQFDKTNELNETVKKINTLSSTIVKASKQFVNLQNAFNSIGASVPKKNNLEKYPDYINRLKSSLKEVAPSFHASVKTLNSSTIQIEQAFTGMGQRIITVMDGVTKATLKASVAGKNIFKSDNGPRVLSRYSKMSNSQMDAFQDKTGKERFKLGITEGIQSETNRASAAFQELFNKLNNAEVKTMDEMRDITEKAGATLKISDVIYKEGKAVEAAYEVMFKNGQKWSGKMRSYTVQNDGKTYSAWSIGEGSGKLRTVDPYKELTEKANTYAKQVQQIAKLEQQRDTAAAQGSRNIVSYLNEQIKTLKKIAQANRDAVTTGTTDTKITGIVTGADKEMRDVKVRQAAIAADAKEAKQVEKLTEQANKYAKQVGQIAKLEQQRENAAVQGSRNTVAYLDKEIRTLKELAEANKDAVLKGTTDTKITGVITDADKAVTDTKAKQAAIAADAKAKQAAIMADAKEAQQVENLINKYKELNKAKTQYYSATKNKDTDSQDRQRALAEVNRLTNEYNQLLAAANQSGVALRNSAKITDSKTQADKEMRDAMAKVDQQAKKNDISFENLSNRLKKVVTEVVQYRIAWEGLSLIDRGIRESITLIRELDTAMTDIRIVTGETSEQVRETINDYAELAKQLGSTTREVANGSIEWLNCWVI